jgi:drug/metabolite transporter (DMT)-like permease
VRGVVPPVALAFWRWLGAFLIVIGPAWPQLRRDWPAMTQRWPVMLLLSACGITAFNTLIYLGLSSTTALNGLILQSAMPVVIILCSFVMFRDRATPRQLIGILLSLLGVLAIVTRGDLRALGSLRLNGGDLLICAGVLAYAFYSALLRARPLVHPLSFVAATFGLGSLMLLPLYGWEQAAGAAVHWTPVAVAAIVYVACFPSVLSYLCWNRGVELIGANRAGQFIHLMPVFGTALAVLLLGESLHAYHLLGAAFICAGLVLATRGAGRG